MKVFISWSGNNSKKLAEALRNWLPSVLQLVKPYFTPSDIEKGTRWNTDIAKELESSEIGILCITRDNLHSDWVMFEAGALSKSLDKAHVCPVLFGIHNTDLAGPLKQFQTTEFNEDEFKKLVSVINGKLGENKLPTKTLDSVFEKWWPELEHDIKQILDSFNDNNLEPIRSEREVLEEVLELSRSTARNIGRSSSSVHPGVIEYLLAVFVDLHNMNAKGESTYQDILNKLREMRKPIKYLLGKVVRRTPSLNSRIEEFNDLVFERNEQNEDEPTLDEDNLPF